MPEGTIAGKPYPIAIGDNGQTLWETTDVAQERDEVWDDWSLGLGETKRETGRGYLFSRGWDASVQGALRLSPFYHNLNNTALTTGYGYMMEEVETSGSTLTLDAASTSSGSVADAGTLSWSHTVASQSERILMVGVAVDSRSVVESNFSATHGGAAMTNLSFKRGTTNVDTAIIVFYLLSPLTGSHNIVVTNNSGGTLAMVGGAESLYGANQDSPIGDIVSATGTDGTPTDTATTAADEILLAVVALDADDTLTAGTNETERWDTAQSTDVTGAGFTQAGADGGVMAPSIDGAVTDWAMIVVAILPSSTTSRSVMQIADTTKIFRYTYDSDTGLALDATDTTTSG
ncbi:hypothetical protein LCGC14_2783280, partial [marine sediment metagenome]